jgi:uncharacterized protein YceH (UPF0502 family)
MTEPGSPDTAATGYDLDPLEIRVLGVLIEKAFITPDSYPLSVNAIISGCNQLTGRDPVLALSEAEVQQAIDGLMARKLISKRDQANARVAKYEHLVRLRHSLPQPEQAVMATLMLRGPQTPGEIRQRCERMHAFSDLAAVEAVLDHLADKFPPMVAPLPRAPGTKETRYAQLLGGEDTLAQFALAASQMSEARPRSHGTSAELAEEVRRLREELDALRDEFAQFRAQFD